MGVIFLKKFWMFDLQKLMFGYIIVITNRIYVWNKENAMPSVRDKNGEKVRRLLPVIVAFDTTGTMKPIRIQIEKEIYTVSMCYLCSTGGPNLTYSCDIKCGNNCGTIEITYMKSARKWYAEL